ncbi:MAG: hypothetical protein KDJ77_00905 [Rhodobiaceae bacterium]|nr:hypothetical protein [Rhodobiaceae bacterium]
MADIAVCVTTHRCPDGLRRTLKALAELDTVHRITVIVGDTDQGQADSAGLAVCSSMARAGYRWPLFATPLAHRNAARVRNAMVAAALDCGAPVYIAFLNDRMAPALNWADRMVGKLRDFGADMVTCPVDMVCEAGAERPADAIRERIFPTPKDGNPAQLVSLDNTMARSSLFPLDRKPWLDPEATLLGLHDALFLTRRGREGVRLAVAERTSIVHLTDADKATPAHLRRRVRERARIAAATRQIMREMSGEAGVPFADIVRAARRIASGGLRFLGGVWRPGVRQAGTARIAVGVGMLDGLFSPRRRPERRRASRSAMPAGYTDNRI